MIRDMLARFTRRRSGDPHNDALQALERIWWSSPHPLGHATRRSVPVPYTSSEEPTEVASLRWFLVKQW